MALTRTSSNFRLAGVGAGVGAGVAEGVRAGVAEGVGLLIATPLLQTNLFPFLIQVYVLFL